MKLKIVLLALGISLSQFNYAQDSTKKKIQEIYFGINGISPLALTIMYKHQLRKNVFLKLGTFRLAYTNIETPSTNINQFPTRDTYYSGGISMGLEFRKQISEKVTFYHGPNGAYRVEHGRNQVFDGSLILENQISFSNNTTPGIFYTVGFLYKLNNHFLIGTEVSPGINYSQSTTSNWSSIYGRQTFTRTSIFGNLNSGGFAQIVYRF